MRQIGRIHRSPSFDNSNATIANTCLNRISARYFVTDGVHLWFDCTVLLRAVTIDPVRLYSTCTMNLRAHQHIPRFMEFKIQYCTLYCTVLYCSITGMGRLQVELLPTLDIFTLKRAPITVVR